MQAFKPVYLLERLTESMPDSALLLDMMAVIALAYTDFSLGFAMPS